MAKSSIRPEAITPSLNFRKSKTSDDRLSTSSPFSCKGAVSRAVANVEWCFSIYTYQQKSRITTTRRVLGVTYPLVDIMSEAFLDFDIF